MNRLELTSVRLLIIIMKMRNPSKYEFSIIWNDLQRTNQQNCPTRVAAQRSQIPVQRTIQKCGKQSSGVSKYLISTSFTSGSSSKIGDRSFRLSQAGTTGLFTWLMIVSYKRQKTSMNCESKEYRSPNFQMTSKGLHGPNEIVLETL